MNDRFTRLFAYASLVPVAFLLSGCGGGASEGRQPVHATRGVITMSGGPLVGATVTFAPLDGQPVAIGRTNDSGEFILTTYDGGDGAAAGKYSVVVMKVSSGSAAPAEEAHSPDGSTPIADGHDATAGADGDDGADGSLIPIAFTKSAETPFSATVEAGAENKFDFDIK